MKVRLVSYSTPTKEFFDDGISNVQELVAFCARVSNPSNQNKRVIFDQDGESEGNLNLVDMMHS